MIQLKLSFFFKFFFNLFMIIYNECWCLFGGVSFLFEDKQNGNKLHKKENAADDCYQGIRKKEASVVFIFLSLCI